MKKILKVLKINVSEGEKIQSGLKDSELHKNGNLYVVPFVSKSDLTVPVLFQMHVFC